jgi:hypothetical protein
MHVRGRSLETGRREPLQARSGVRGRRLALKCEVCGANLFYGREKVERRCIKCPKEQG